jgi:cis-L-3-hydroxyproline dehydratase
MLSLTDYEKKMIDGELGRFKQAAMAKIVAYAKALDAEELCEITKATLFLGAHRYLEVIKSDDYDEIFSKMLLCTDDNIPIERFAEGCTCQSCATVCDQYVWEPLGISKDLFDRNNRFLEITKEAGVSIVNSCTPYFTGWLPLRGEHFVTTESSNVVMCNSIMGAYGNADGIEAAAWSAICGRTPKWGNHIEENRKGTHIFDITCPSETAADWDIIGYTIGRKLPTGGKPIINGNFKRPDIVKLKQCFASLATTSAAEICHIVGITPESYTLEMGLGGKQELERYQITKEDYEQSLQMLCDSGSADVQLISLGCPHYSLEEIRQVAEYIKGKKIKKDVKLMIWTDYAIKYMADINHYTKIIEDAGGHIYTNSCVGLVSCYDGVTGLVMGGAKLAHYCRSTTKAKVFFGTMENCINAAVKGRWEG